MDEETRPNKFVTLLKSRKFWASIIGLIVATGVLEGSGIEEARLVEAVLIVATAIAYGFSTASRMGFRGDNMAIDYEAAEPSQLGRRYRNTLLKQRLERIALGVMSETADVTRPAWTEGGDARLSQSTTTVYENVPCRRRIPSGDAIENEMMHASGADLVIHTPLELTFKQDDVLTIGGREHTVMYIGPISAYTPERILYCRTTYEGGDTLT